MTIGETRKRENRGGYGYETSGNVEDRRCGRVGGARTLSPPDPEDSPLGVAHRRTLSTSQSMVPCC